MTDTEISERLDGIIERYNAGAMPDGAADLKEHLLALIRQVILDIEERAS